MKSVVATLALAGSALAFSPQTAPVVSNSNALKFVE